MKKIKMSKAQRRRVITAAVLSGVMSALWICAGLLPGSRLTWLTVVTGLVVPAAVAFLGLLIAEASGAAAQVERRGREDHAARPRTSSRTGSRG